MSACCLCGIDYSITKAEIETLKGRIKYLEAIKDAYRGDKFNLERQYSELFDKYQTLKTKLEETLNGVT